MNANHPILVASCHHQDIQVHRGCQNPPTIMIYLVSTHLGTPGGAEQLNLLPREGMSQQNPLIRKGNDSRWLEKVSGVSPYNLLKYELLRSVLRKPVIFFIDGMLIIPSLSPIRIYDLACGRGFTVSWGGIGGAIGGAW